MKKFVYSAFFWLFCSSFILGQVKWPAAAIPENLRENAHAVMRKSETFYTVRNSGEGQRKVHYIVTILDQQGIEYSTLTVRYDKLSKVTNIEGTLYNTLGEKIKTLKKGDISDQSGISNTNLFDDVRYKVGQFNYASFPFTVEFSYEETDRNMLSYESWYPHFDSENLAVEQDFFKISVPASLDLRYKELNGIGAAVTEENNGIKSYSWMVKNLPVLEKEPYAPRKIKYGPGVITAPNEFEVEGYQGKMSSWKDLGEFDNVLCKNRDILPEETIAEVKQLTSGITDPVQKVKKLYEYMQNKTRYISIQLGIGGWQPFEAKYVAEKGYGDCKALSNFMKSILKSANIESYYTSIQAGDDKADILTDFPSQQFNHVILCVPMKQDSIWLECTSQTNPFGYLSDFTSGRHALLATPEGGKLVMTPGYGEKDNLQHRNIQVVLNEEGDAEAETSMLFTGILQDDYASAISRMNDDEQKKFMYSQIHIPNFDLVKFSIQNEKKTIPVSKVKNSLLIRKCASKSGTRMFLNPNLMSVFNQILPVTDKSRKHDVELINAYTETDSVMFQLPAKAIIEAQPAPVNIETAFGKYQSEVKIKDQKLYYYRKFIRKRGIFPPGSYAELADFYKKISKADRAQVVMKL